MDSKVKMIALDLDRTTLKDSKTMSDATAETLERAGEMGTMVVIATGRVYDALPDIVHELSSVKYFICSNGASVFDAETGDIIFEKCLESEAVETMVACVREKNFMFESFTGGYAYIGRDYFEMVRDRKLPYRGRDYVLATRTPVDDIFGFTLEHKDRIENLNVFFPDQEEKEEMRGKLSVIPDSVLTSSIPSNLELGGNGVSKGAALSFLMERESMTRESLMAVGDSPNDLSMLELAAYPVAVGNAEQEVKDAAIYIAPTNEEDGVADAIRKYVF